MYKNGLKQKEISNLSCCSQTSVSRIIKQAQQNEIVTDHKEGAGCPKRTSAREDRVIRRIVAKRRFTTILGYVSDALNAGINISKITMHRRLDELCYKSYDPNKKPLINAKQRNKRIQWCKNQV